MNITVLRGRLNDEPVVRNLPSGGRVATFNIGTRPKSDGPIFSVPVSVWDPDEDTLSRWAGDEVIVVGVVRRRFWRAGAGAASRVEVEATLVRRATPAGLTAAAEALTAAAQTLV